MQTTMRFTGCPNKVRMSPKFLPGGNIRTPEMDVKTRVSVEPTQYLGTNVTYFLTGFMVAVQWSQFEKSQFRVENEILERHKILTSSNLRRLLRISNNLPKSEKKNDKIIQKCPKQIWGKFLAGRLRVWSRNFGRCRATRYIKWIIFIELSTGEKRRKNLWQKANCLISISHLCCMSSS